VSKQCPCGNGYKSRYDGKCGKCRTTREQREHEYKLRHDLYLITKMEKLL
jgi:hypothetical protein